LGFYQKVFKTELSGPVMRMRDAPSTPGAPALSDREKNMIMHAELPIVGGHMLMFSDAVESMGHKVVFGTNVNINLEPDTRAESKGLFDALAAGGKVIMPLAEMFWGGYFGCLTDRFGVQWMVNCSAKE
jgi:PhnB protein